MTAEDYCSRGYPVLALPLLANFGLPKCQSELFSSAACLVSTCTSFCLCRVCRASWKPAGTCHICSCLVLSLPISGMCPSITNISHWVYEWFTPKVWLRHALTGSNITWNSSKKSRKFFLGIYHRTPYVYNRYRTCSTALNGRTAFWTLRWPGFSFYYSDSCWCPSCVLDHCLKTKFSHMASLLCPPDFQKVHSIMMVHL